MQKAQKAYQTAAHDFDPAKRDEVIEELAPLIKFIAHRLSLRLPSHVEVDDLISAGVIGLMDAIEKFDPTRGILFKTYAEFRIKGAMLDDLRAQDWVPRSVRQKAAVLERAYEEIEQREGRPATEEEVAEALNMAMEVFYELLNSARGLSLISIDGAEDEMTLNKRVLESLTSPAEDNPFHQLRRKELKEVLARIIDQLPPKERMVVSLYYYDELTMKEIGKVLNITESRVSQIHTQVMLRLRGKLKKIYR